MKYDIAAKVVIDIAKTAILKRFLQMDADEIYFIEDLPEEMPSIRRSDFPLRVFAKDGYNLIVLIEIQTVFNQDFVLRLIDYTVRFKLKYHVRIIPLTLLLTPSQQATGFYEDDILTFRYQLVKFWEEEARNFLDETTLYPFLPLMNGGEKLIDEIDRNIYGNTKINIEQKADLLTATAIFTGLKDKQLASELIKRRRDIMIESPIYELIKEEGKLEGRMEGKIEGKIEGKVEGLQEAISLGLELKFGADVLTLMEKVQKIGSIEKLEKIKESIRKAKRIEEVEKLI